MDESKIIFEYKTLTSFGWFGKSYGGFSVDIFDDGTLIYITYIFSEEEKSRQVYKLPSDAVSKILSVFEKHRTELKSLKDVNGRLGQHDGSLDTFIFGTYKVESYATDYIDEKDERWLRYCYPDYDSKHRDGLMLQNKMLDIFYEIASELEKYGVQLTTSRISFSDNVEKQ